MHKDFEVLPHTADIKIRAYGATIKELYKHALSGMFQSIKPISSECHYNNDRLVCPALPQHHELSLYSSDYELLLIDFLSKALYFSDVYNEAYLDATIDELTPTTLKATIHGVQIEGFEVVEIKAVTYHELIVAQLPDGTWYADIVFDI